MERYCCRECQVSHWPRHKHECKKSAAELLDKELFKDPPEREECPICMLPFPFSDGEKDVLVFFACCGRLICMGCLRAQFKEDVNNGKDLEDCQACAFCRTPATQDAEERIRRLNRNVERNHAFSINELASYYMLGREGLEKDIAKAIELFEKSAQLGHADSYYWLGDIYKDGSDGIQIDTKKARQYYELGTIGGSIIARSNLAALDWKDGNSKRALKHFLICVKFGIRLPAEMWKFGCEKGYVTKNEYAEALMAYQKRLEDTKSETRDEALGFGNSELAWKKYYFQLKATKFIKEGEFSSLYDLASFEWDNGNYPLACAGFLSCVDAGIKPALRRLKIAVEEGYVTGHNYNFYAEALRARQNQR